MKQPLPTAAGFRDIARELLTLSLKQSELLDHGNYSALTDLAERKEGLLKQLAAHSAEARKRGWILHDPDTFPTEETCSGLLRETADLLRRLQSHEKYVAGLMTAQQMQIGARLDEILTKRTAAVGYGFPTLRGRAVDRAG